MRSLATCPTRRAGRATALAAALVLPSAVGPGCPCRPAPRLCGPETCPGCCDDQWVCHERTEASRCGVEGRACVDCAARGEACLSGQCAPEPDAGADADVDAGSDGSVDAGPPTIPRGEFCRRYLEAYCARRERCVQLDPAQSADCPVLTAWKCHQALLDALESGGEISYDAAGAAQCAQDERTGGCDDPELFRPASCGQVFGRATPVGRPCTRQWWAAYACVNGYCDGTACPGQCKAYLPVASPCTGVPGDQCGPSAYCALTDPRRCTEYLAAGATCTPNDQCADGVCDSAAWRCVKTRSLGEGAACTVDLVCAVGQYCKQGLCAPAEVQGGPCRRGLEDDCANAFTCRIGDGGTFGTCQPRSDEGGPCYGLVRDCKPGLRCTSPAFLAAGTCVAFQSEGAPCDLAAQNCKVALLCDRNSKTCRRLPRLAEPCVRDPLNTVSSDCLGGLCPETDGGTTRCVPPVGSGVSCGRAYECASAFCENGTCADLCTLE